MPQRINRRQFLSGAVGTGLTLSFAGIVSADGVTRYIARLRGRGATRRLERAGFDIEHRLAGGKVAILRGSDGSLEALRGIRGVHLAVEDVRFELEPPVAIEQSDLIEPAQFFSENQWDNTVTSAPDAHETATGTGATLAIIDTGIDDGHPDLGNVDESSSASIIGGAIGPHDGDVDGHGTHVAGIAGATGAVGVTGIAPGATLVSIRVFDDDGGASFGDILLAIQYAAAIGADGANMSIGTPPIPPEENRFQYRGIMEPIVQSATASGTVLVGSAGNSAANLQQGGFFTLPNSLQGVLSISATAPNDRLTYYSNFGTNEIDLGAPGGGYETLAMSLCGYQEWLLAGAPSRISEDPREEGEMGTLWLDEDGIPTTDLAAVDDAVQCPLPAWPVPFNFVFNTFVGGSYAWLAGTSMAAPQVTGAVALVREVAPDANARQVEQTIKHGAALVQGRNDPGLGAGRLDAAGALEHVQVGRSRRGRP